MHRLRPGDCRRRRTHLTQAAHKALVAGFVVLGAIDGVWVARLPALKHRLALDNGRLGVVLFIVSLAATLALPLAGWLTARQGSRVPIALALALAAAMLGLAAYAPAYGSLLGIAVVFGAGLGCADVALNAHGVELEHRIGRTLLSPLHAAWSFGLLGGSAFTAVAAAVGVGVRVQMPAAAAAFALILAVAVPKLLPGTAAAAESARFALPRGPLALPAALMFCALFIEFAAMNWSAVFLNGPAGSSSAVAAGAVVVYAGAMGVARLFGDRLMLRWGIGELARRSGAISFVGILLAITTRSTIPALAGFALVGIGCAAIVPALFRVGGSAPGVARGVGIAAVATAGYTGGLCNGPAVGFLARAVGLSGALGLVAVAAAVITVFGPRLVSSA